MKRYRYAYTAKPVNATRTFDYMVSQFCFEGSNAYWFRVVLLNKHGNQMSDSSVLEGVGVRVTGVDLPPPQQDHLNS